MKKYGITLAPTNELDYDNCFADTFEVLENGTLVFYKYSENNTTGEFIKMYASGYWLECTDDGEVKR